MPVIALQGIRGGSGTTSITAALAWALNQLGESVLVMDFSASNQLAAHFNLPLNITRGWMRAMLDKDDWQQSALRYLPELDLVPFGGLNEQERQMPEQAAVDHLSGWLEHLPDLKNHYRWLLLDVPAEENCWSRHILAQADHHLCLLTADANCQLRLHQRRFDVNTYFLLNQFNANSQSQQDLQQLWLSGLNNLVPVNIHRDEALAESLLMKQPAGEYRPGSLAVEELTTLASWVLINFSGLRR
ncbi:cellulose synthase operon protein YhjQ [Erwinia toletana]|uniref:Cellulose synthase operon protein YhjQ n=1 Tax=Winslowiella toletana TaxID=92490 RepID=A0ABS4P8D7_9GAMM|nr:cellulose biosynthesis protein BcsQ [Winslowiella toletana]MBP2168897.1 cellulose synthase operon protein YhjQ [Winslowiella toletana]